MLGFCLPAHASESSVVPPKINLRVIYFGEEGAAREKDFAAFLTNHFAVVGTGNLEEFQETKAKGYDVVILDYGEVKISGNRIEMPKKIVSRSFSRPTMTLGATGGLVSGRLRLKTDYL